MQALIKRCDAIVVMQQQAMHKFVAHCGLQLTQAAQVLRTHGG